MSAIHAFIHCRRCVVGRQTQRLEVGLTSEGLRVQCKKHGLVGDFTPASLAARLAHPPECECCQGLRGEPS
jgi:hypothetical protein